MILGKQILPLQDYYQQHSTAEQKDHEQYSAILPRKKQRQPATWQPFSQSLNKLSKSLRFQFANGFAKISKLVYYYVAI